MLESGGTRLGIDRMSTGVKGSACVGTDSVDVDDVDGADSSTTSGGSVAGKS